MSRASWSVAVTESPELLCLLCHFSLMDSWTGSRGNLLSIIQMATLYHGTSVAQGVSRHEGGAQAKTAAATKKAECRLLTEARGLVEKEEMREWGTRHSRDKRKKKGDVGTENEEEKEEGERLANFFSAIYGFFVPTPAFVPAELPARYAIDFVPVVSAVSATSPVANPVPVFILLHLFRFPFPHPIIPSFLPLTSLFLRSISFLLVLIQTHSYVL